MELKVVSDTLFKLSTELSDKLSDAEKVFVKNGTIYPVHSHAPDKGDHVRVALADTFLGPKNRNTWYVYRLDVEFEGNEPDNQPKDQEKVVKSKDVTIKLPGNTSQFSLSSPIISNGHFTWGEATKGGTRIPVDTNVVQGILSIAKVMEEVRSLLGDKPIQVNSWYRDPATNRRVGGASRSRHLSGDAVDFVVKGMTPFQVYDKLNPWWGARGGLASSSVFTHIDARGYKARWSYGY
ncbi:MAG: D-Ala-D-Ala carboxypeptidase family metallohydrolase [Leptolyngbyaceae cyanobacterium MO_188.B28]|nr:D-Ala-D-Ala carboxypeptidase family metallohydrolase [Leptolyngbyaceae cyanobacterium MO_188.B28]